jgi:hypothetical protein
VNSSGIAVQQFVTNSPDLFAPYKDEDIHGGPPLILVPGATSNMGQPYYLGIFHFFQVSYFGNQLSVGPTSAVACVMPLCTFKQACVT